MVSARLRGISVPPYDVQPVGSYPLSDVNGHATLVANLGRALASGGRFRRCVSRCSSRVSNARAWECALSTSRNTASAFLAWTLQGSRAHVCVPRVVPGTDSSKERGDEHL